MVTLTGEVDMREGDFRVRLEVFASSIGFIGYSEATTSDSYSGTYSLTGGLGSCGTMIGYVIRSY